MALGFGVDSVPRVRLSGTVGLFGSLTYTSAPSGGGWTVNGGAISFIEGDQTPFNVAATGPSGAIAGGTYSVDPSGAQLPNGMILTPEGSLTVGTAKSTTITGVKFRYTEPGLPYALPTAGTVSKITFGGSNVANQIRPAYMTGGKWQYSLLASYGAGAFLPDYSAQGAFIIAGTGGHGAPPNFGGAIFDFATGLWRYRSNGNGFTEKLYGGTEGDVLTTDTNGSNVRELLGTTPADSMPAPSHQYRYGLSIPKAVTGGAKGKFILPVMAATCENGSDGWYAHSFDPTTGVWARLSTNNAKTTMNLGEAATNGSACYVEYGADKRIYITADIRQKGHMPYLDCVDWTWKQQWPSSTPDAVIKTLWWDKANNLMLALCDDGAITLRAWNLADNAWYTLDATGLVGLSVPFHKYSDGSFYALDGAGVLENNESAPEPAVNQFLYKLTPPASTPLTSQWTMTTAPISGGITAAWAQDRTNSGSTHCTRFWYVPALDCFAWFPRGDAPVELIKPGVAGGGGSSGFTIGSTPYATLAAALAASAPGDTIVGVPGVYVEHNLLITHALTLRSSVPGQKVVLDGTGTPASTDILAVDANVTGNVLIEDFEFKDNKIHWDTNAGFATYGKTGNITLRRVKIGNCSNGILTGMGDDTCNLLIEDSEFLDCGDDEGLRHNIYVGRVASLTMRGCWSHMTKSKADYPGEEWRESAGHLVKTRALVTVLEACRLTMEKQSSDGGANRCIDAGNGGDITIDGCHLEFRTGQNSGIGDLFAWGVEGTNTLPGNVYEAGRTFKIRFRQNTIVARCDPPGQNKRAFNLGIGAVSGGGTPMPAPTVYEVKDNIFCGWADTPPFVANWSEDSGNTSSVTYAISTVDNTCGPLTLLTDAEFYQYTPVTPVAGAQNWAAREYVHPASTKARSDAYRGGVAYYVRGFTVWRSGSQVGGNNATLNAAIAAAVNGDVIIGAPGLYTGAGNAGASITKSVTFKSAVGGQRVIIDGQHALGTGGAAILYVSNAATVVLEDIEVKNNKPSEYTYNAGFYMLNSGVNLTMRRCVGSECNNNLLTSLSATTGTLLLEYCEFYNGGDWSDKHHNIYTDCIDSFTMRGCWVHNTKNYDNYPPAENWKVSAGHLVKSRARFVVIEGNRLTMEVVTGEGSTVGANRCIDHSCGGDLTVRGNLIEFRSRNARGMGQAVQWGAEGAHKIPGTVWDRSSWKIQIQQNTIVARAPVQAGYESNSQFFLMGIGARDVDGDNLSLTPAPTVYDVRDNFFVGWLNNDPKVINEKWVGPGNGDVVREPAAAQYVVSATTNTVGDLSLLTNAASYDYTPVTEVAGSQNWATLEYVHPKTTKARTDTDRGGVSK